MDKDIKHAPLPYYVSGSAVVAETSRIDPVASTYQGGNAEFIVRACNSHYELLEAMQGVMWMVESYDGKSNETDLLIDAYQAAIAKAEGK